MAVKKAAAKTKTTTKAKLMEALGLAEVEHNAKNNRMRAL
jgi:hypothetical protein